MAGGSTQTAVAVALWPLVQIERLGEFVLNFGFGDLPAVFERYCGVWFARVVMFSVGLATIAVAFNLVVVQALAPLASWIFGAEMPGPSLFARIVAYVFYVGALFCLGYAVYAAMRTRRLLLTTRSLSTQAEETLRETKSLMDSARKLNSPPPPPQ